MNAYVFLGPTVPADEAREQLEAVYLPPASEGDVYRVTCKKPKAIGIIDGYFECVPAVWHKEILWAMAQGIYVFGSSSMGALRAAELAAFGMEGVGKIYEAYRDGTLEDDDEVAVTHTSADRGYQAASEAMVNIRATFEAAEKAGIISRALRRKLEKIAKDLHYKARSYTAVLLRAEERGLSVQLEALRHWLPTGQVDQKREDALLMLRAMRALLNSNPPPKHVKYTFEYTANWEVARSRAGSLRIDSLERSDTISIDRLLDELRLDGVDYSRTHQLALLRFLGLEEARRQGIVPTSGMVRDAAQSFRRENGIEDQETFEQWLFENGLSHDEFRDLMKDEASLAWVRDLAEVDMPALLTDHLRLTGQYARLVSRARAKQSTLDPEGLQYPTSPQPGLSEDELVRWYFEERLKRTVPADLPLYCRLAGFRDESSFRRAIRREYCYAGRKPIR